MPELPSAMSEQPLHCTGGPVSGPPPTGGWSPRCAALPAESPPPAPAEGPLDLTTRPGGSAGHPLVMDLSLPDKDSPVEACYTCGTLVRRSSLHTLLLLRRHRTSHEPFFPSLLEHSRPAGSRPMTPDGRVSVCACCLHSLVAQWDTYQKENRVVPGRRSYALCADGGRSPFGEFVCYMCCLTYSVTCLSRVRVAAGVAGEPFYRDVLRPITPPGAEGVRAGAVSVCVNCKRKAALQHALQQDRPPPEDSHLSRIIEEAVRETRVRPAPAPAAAVPHASTFHNIRVRRREVVCLSCHGTHQLDFMAEVRFHSSDAARMHFPALAAQPPPTGAAVGRGGALVCVPCFRVLKIQWQAYQESGTAPADRVYSTRRGSCGSESEPARDSPALPDTPPAGVEESQPASQSFPPVSQGFLSVSQSSVPVNKGSHAVSRSSPPVTRSSSSATCSSPPASLSGPLASRGCPPVSGGLPAGRPAATEPADATAQRKRRRPDAATPAGAKQRRPASQADSGPSSTPMSLVAPSTVTAGCYACHQPLEANCAYQVRTEPDAEDASAQFFPHLAQQRHLPAPVCSVAVCVYCYHTLADQWARYERLSRKIDPYHREYDTHNFICFVCSVRTYRKRLHVIDVKDFPFLTASHRYPEGALLICSNTKSVVCRDCHGTLHCQFQDYERWNLPVNKREYNWVARPPPPESPEPYGRPETVSPGRWTQ